MAQKIFPRSLRTPILVSNNFSLYSDSFLTSMWSKSYQLLYKFYNLSLRNLIAKKRRKFGRKKKSRNKMLSSFSLSRFSVLTQNSQIVISPILMKFANRSFSKKYHPIRAILKTRRFFQKKLNSKKTSFKISKFQ